MTATPSRGRPGPSLSRALALSAAVLALLLLGLAVVFRVVDSTSEAAQRQAEETSRAAGEMLAVAEDVHISAFLLLGAREPAAAGRLEARMRDGLARLPAMAGRLGVAGAQVEALDGAYQEVLALHGDFRIKQAGVVMCDRVQAAHEALAAGIAARGGVLMREAAAAVDSAKRTGYVLIYGTMAAAVLIAAVAAAMQRRLIRGVEATVEALNAAARGDLEHPLAAGGGREFAQIAQGIENLRRALRRTLDEVHRLAGRGGAAGGSLGALIDDVGALRAELERTFAELRQSEERFRSVVTNLPCAVVRQQADGTVAAVYVSQAIADITGLEPGAFLGPGAVPLASCIHDDDRPQAEAALAAAIAGEQTFERGYRMQHRDGSLRWVQERGRVIAVAGAARRYVDSVIVDVTARRQLEERMAQSQKLEAVGTLASGIAHDFNNILAAIIGSAELLRRRCDEDPRQAEHLARISAACGRARSLVRQILLFARSVPGERRPVEFAPVVREALGLVRASLPATIAIRQWLAPGLVVLGDPTRLHQLVMNLCTNAGLAMPDGGTLEVELSAIVVDDALAARHAGLAPGPAARLVVRDDGVGMAPEVVGRIFEPFFTTRPQGQGSGLGLAVVHGVVRECGGAITVYSEPGQGSSFAVMLPLAGEAERPASVDQGVPRGSERILFVDDEAPLRAIAAEMLAGLGYVVILARDGQEALELVRGRPQDFDLVVTDVTMPRMTGPELLRQVRALHPGLKVLFSTGRSIDFQAGRPEGVGLVGKPFTRAELAVAIRAALGPPAG